MKPKKVLVFYKRSAYQIYFLGKKSSLLKKKGNIDAHALSELKKADTEHFKTLKCVTETLRNKGVRYIKRTRGRRVNVNQFDFVIAVGGDGTFLEAARELRSQTILGVNSDKARSVGRYCAATRLNFDRIFEKILCDKARIIKLHRIRLNLNGRFAVNILNDALVCHANPAAVSRYSLSVGKRREEQRSSGLWISTSSGSSGAIKSAGGKVLQMTGSKVQYRPRELLKLKRLNCQLTGGVVRLGQPVKVGSLMRRGMIYVDGTHVSFPFELGDTAVFSNSLHPIKIVYR